MVIKVLSREQREKVFNEHLVKDFHKSEVKPLELIEQLIEEGKYLCYGVFMEKEEDLLGYAYFARIELNKKPIMVLDFFAVVARARSRGLGSSILKVLKHSLSEKCIVILAEVENPTYGQDDEDKKLRNRRISFYHRNGLKTTKVLSRVFENEYQIMVLNIENQLTDEEVKESMKMTYISLYGQEFYDNNIDVRYESGQRR